MTTEARVTAASARAASLRWLRTAFPEHLDDLSSALRGPDCARTVGREFGRALTECIGAREESLVDAVKDFLFRRMADPVEFRLGMAEELGVTKEAEAALIAEIRAEVAHQPGSLYMRFWHCRTSHCLAGWCEELRPRAVAAAFGDHPDVAVLFGIVCLPRHCHRFFGATEDVRAWLMRPSASRILT